MTLPKMKLVLPRWLAVRSPALRANRRAGEGWQRTRWTWHRITDRLGRGGAFMLMAIVALCWYRLGVQIPRIATLEQERQSVAKVLRNLPPAASADAGHRKQSAEMPGAQEILEQKFIILAVLKEHQLIVENVTYKSESLAQEKLKKTVMDITLVGRYGDFSEALAVLYKMGGIQVDMAAFERSKIASPVVNMRLQLALLGAENA